MVNHKRVQRLWREEGLQRPTPRKRKRARPADGSVRRHRAEHPHQVWAMDFQFDATADGRRLKFLNVIDEHSRLCLAIRVGRRCKAKDVVAVLEELTSVYPAPAFIRSDNGPEFIAQALRDWCEASTTTSTAYIAPGSPWENGFAESYELRSTSSTTDGSGMSSSTLNCSPLLQRLNSSPIAGVGSTTHSGRTRPSSRADSKCQIGFSSGCRIAIARSAVMSCITACRPSRIESNPARRSRFRAAVRIAARTAAPFPR